MFYRLAAITLIFCLSACSSDPDPTMSSDPGTEDMNATEDVSSSDVADVSSDTDAATFECFGETCRIGEEYCPGTFCSGEPAPDSGVCPAGCERCLSGAGLEFCQCDLPGCTPLPDGCDDCSCIEPQEIGCMCEEGRDGSIRVACISA